jgi:hypothetical protein
MAALTAITITSTATVTGCGSSNNDNAAATKTTMTPGQMSGHSSHDSTMRGPAKIGRKVHQDPERALIAGYLSTRRRSSARVRSSALGRV